MSEVDEYYKRRADEMVKLLFDRRFLNDDLSLESIEWLKDYLGFVIQSFSDSAARTAVLTAKMRDKKNDEQT